MLSGREWITKSRRKGGRLLVRHDIISTHRLECGGCNSHHLNTHTVHHLYAGMHRSHSARSAALIGNPIMLSPGKKVLITLLLLLRRNSNFVIPNSRAKHSRSHRRTRSWLPDQDPERCDPGRKKPSPRRVHSTVKQF